MPSARRWPVGVLLALTLLTGVIGAVTAWQRTLYPVSLSGSITSVTVRSEHQPGVDDYVRIVVDGQGRVVTDGALTCLSEGSVVDKSAWSATVQVDGRPCVLAPARQAWADTLGLLVLVAALGLVGWLGRSRHARVPVPAEPQRRGKVDRSDIL